MKKAILFVRVFGVILLVILALGFMYYTISPSFVDTTQTDKDYLYQVVEKVVSEDSIKIAQIPEDVKKDFIGDNAIILKRGDFQIKIEFFSNGVVDIVGTSIRETNVTGMIVTAVGGIIIVFVGLAYIINTIWDYKNKQNK